MPRLWSPLLLALLASLAQAQNNLEQVPLYREIKDWVVACDNLRSCQAISAVEYSPLTLEIQRDAGAQAVARLRLRYAGQSDHFPLLLDEQPLPDPLTNALRLEPADDQLILAAEGDAVRALLAELRNGQTLRMAVTSEDEAKVSLAGLSAALLLMDAVQGRVDNRSALYRPGTLGDHVVPSPPPAPQLRAYPGVPPLAEAERQRIAEAVMAATGGEWREQGTDEKAEAEAFALNPREALVLIQIGCAAYNCEFALYRVMRSAPYTQQPLQIEPLPLGYSGLSGWVSYDEKTGSLAYFMKGRGIADCGDSGSWLFDGERFQLQSFNLMTRCTGGNPGEWPALWRVAAE